MTDRQRRLTFLDQAIRDVIYGSGRIADLIDSLDCAYDALEPGDLAAAIDPTERSHAWEINCYNIKQNDALVSQTVCRDWHKSDALATMDKQRVDHITRKFDKDGMRYEEYIRTYDWKLEQVTCR
jgi:hypothetical protein